MEMVAASKLKRTQGRLLASRPYSRCIGELLEHLIEASAQERDFPSRENASPPYRHPFLEQRQTGKAALVIFTADRGLCAGYNLNILKLAENFLRDFTPENVCLLVIGRRGYNYLRRRKWQILSGFYDFGGKIESHRIEQIYQAISSSYLDGTLREVYFVYTSFKSQGVFRPMVTRVLPIQNTSDGKPVQESRGGSLHSSMPADSAAGHVKSGMKPGEYIYEPRKETIFEKLLPRYLYTRVYMSFLESLTSEHSARMVSMRNATDNADEMIEHLTLVRNKARQASITKEISEIVAGAEALK
jgi:F-type H+-transporting ATPase subunit gamma